MADQTKHIYALGFHRKTLLILASYLDKLTRNENRGAKLWVTKVGSWMGVTGGAAYVLVVSSRQQEKYP